MTFGVIVGNRGFFPGHLAQSGRSEMLAAIEKAGYQAVAPGPEDTRFGAVETRAEAALCADLFKKHRDSIDGVIVTLPNFGDERGVADTLRMAGLGVPVLVQATPDTPGRMTIQDRRDSFCGKMSACNNLTQYGIPYSLTTRHTEAPDSECFRQDLDWFAAVCRVVRGLRRSAHRRHRRAARGLQHRPLQREDPRGQRHLRRTHRPFRNPGPHRAHGRPAPRGASPNWRPSGAMCPPRACPPKPLLKMAKLGAVVDEWMAQTECAISAVQCWTSLEEFFGVVPCTVMSMMSESLMSSACEVDICGVVGMHALQLASGTPSALLDWNNNYGDDPDKAVCFHCSNLPKHFFKESRMDFQQIIAGTVGRDNTYGTCVGRVKSGPMSFARFSTNDRQGSIHGYVGEGEFTDDPLETFGGAGVVRIPRLQELLRFICERGFEHHVAANLAPVAAAVQEAATRYLGWSVYQHS